MKKSMQTLLSMVLVCTIFLSNCRAPIVKSDDSATNEIPVELAPITTEEITLPIKGSGLLSSDKEARLSFKIGGIIDRIYVEEGQAVRKGQLLARLDLTEINAKVTQAQNAVDKAQRDVQRIQNLYKDDAATLEQVQDLTTLQKVAKEDLRIAQFNQKYAEIRAVSNGKIVQKMMNEGELIGPGTPVFFMNDTNNQEWTLAIGIADKDWARLRKGDRATISLGAYPELTFTGKVIRLAEGVDPSNGTYQVDIQVNPNHKKVAKGMFATAEIFPNDAQVYRTIPVESLVDAHGQEGYVFVPNTDSTVMRQPVEIAFIRAERVALRRGIENVDAVVSVGAGFLNEFSKIRLPQ
ncbi:MAG: efflux RND transporter periplasmic adaptor subunit [Bacteroidota bacterium]